MKKIILTLGILFIIVLVSCDDGGTESSKVEPFDIQRAFKSLRPFSEFVNGRVMEDEDFSRANIIEIAVTSSDSVLFKKKAGPNAYTYVYAFAETPSKIENIYFDEFLLPLDVIVFTVIHYKYPSNWDRLKFRYDNSYEWKIFTKEDTLIERADYLQKIHEIKFSFDEELVLGNAFQIEWSKSDKEDRMWLDLEYIKYTGERQFIRGQELDDTGQFGFSSNYLLDKGITEPGYIIFHFMRMDKKLSLVDLPENEGNVLVNYGVMVSKVAVPVANE